MKAFSYALLCLLATVALSSSAHAIILDGEPQEGDSWSQKFKQSWSEYGGNKPDGGHYRPFDLIAVKMVSPGDYFERPVFKDFSSTPSNSEWVSYTAGDPWPNLLLISAAQTADWSKTLTFKMVFDGKKSNSLVFDVAVYAVTVDNEFKYIGEIEDPVQTQRAYWDGTNKKWTIVPAEYWTPTRTELYGMMSPYAGGGLVPEPSSMLIWTIMGGAVVAGIWYRRRRAAA